MNRETFECERELGKSAEEAEGMVRLHEFSTRLVATSELPLMLEEVLNATIALQCADFGNVQLYNPRTQGLEIVAQRGLGRISSIISAPRRKAALPVSAPSSAPSGSS